MASRRLVSASARETLFGIPSDTASLERNYVLADDDLDLICTRRSAENRLGLAIHTESSAEARFDKAQRHASSTAEQIDNFVTHTVSIFSSVPFPSVVVLRNREILSTRALWSLVSHSQTVRTFQPSFLNRSSERESRARFLAIFACQKSKFEDGRAKLFPTSPILGSRRG